MNARELEALEAKIATAEKEKATAEGALGQVMERLEQEFGCKTIDEAEEEIARLEQQISKRSTKIDTMAEELRTAMEEATR